MIATMYSKPNCDFCVKAMKELDSRGYLVTEIKLGRDINDRIEFIKEIQNKSGSTPQTVPQIFLGEEQQYIGGYDDLIIHFSKK